MRLDLDFALRPSPCPTSHAQVAAIPLRWVDAKPEILLVTTRGKGRWTVPKGWPLTEAPNAACAAREAFEEAGVTGYVAPYSLGVFQYEKKLGSAKNWFSATGFVLQVETEHDNWPERNERKRAWFALDEAKALVENEDLAVLMDEAVQRSQQRRRRKAAPQEARALILQ